MKKVCILVITLIIALSCFSTYSLGSIISIPINLEPSIVNVPTNEHEFTVKLNIGNLMGVTQGTVLGYQSFLVYDEDVIDSVSIKTYEEWDKANYNPSTKVLLIAGNTETKPNSTIAEMTFKLKDTFNQNMKTKILLSDIIVSGTDGTEVEVPDVEIDVNITRVSEEQGQEDANQIQNEITQNITEEENQMQNTMSDKVENKVIKVDSTTSNAKLPQTGITQVVLWSILIITIIAVFCIIRYKTMMK